MPRSLLRLNLTMGDARTVLLASNRRRNVKEAHALLARAGQGRQLPTRALEAISPTTPRSRRWPRSIGRSPSIRPSPGPPRLRGDINAKLNGGKTP